MAVRSKRLWGPTTITGSPVLLYTCPAGETALIKQLEVGPAGGIGATVTFYLNGTAVGTRLHSLGLAANSWSSEAGLFIVLHPGDELRAAVSTGSVQVSGFGAELEGVAD